VRKDGERFYCSGEVAALQGEGVQGFVKIARDLTENMRFREQQLQNLQESQNSSHLKDEFFAVMSHELKHPLNLIQLNAQVLRRLPGIKSIPAAFKAAAVIGDAVNSQARIIDDLMDVARVRTGKLQLERQVVDFAALLAEIERVVEHSEHGCEITFEIPPETERELFIHADPTRVEQIVWNLINNAIKFTPREGSIHVVASKVDGYARLEVRDTGPGIAEDQLDQIFVMFSQADHRAIGRHHGGLGVGLSLVKQLVESHEGQIRACSAGAGKGSTFTVELPLCGVPTPGTTAHDTEDEGKLQGLRILLVDDAVDVLETMALLLEMESAQVAAFSNPMEALVRAQQDNFDVVISDVSMPGMDGYEFVHQLRQADAYRTTPCIALTGYGANRGDQEGRGFDEHLGKPVAYDDFVSLVARMAHAPSSNRA
jgi:two-component system CheB/CheR fusion protein